MQRLTSRSKVFSDLETGLNRNNNGIEIEIELRKSVKSYEVKLKKLIFKPYNL